MNTKERLVLARFSIGKTIPVVILAWLMLAALFWVTTPHDSRSLLEFLWSKGAFWVLFNPIGWLAGIAMAFLLLAVMSQLIFDRRRALWICGDDIVYLNSRFMSVQRNRISKISIGSSRAHGLPGIILELTNGNTKRIPIATLSETGEAILFRLKEAIG